VVLSDIQLYNIEFVGFPQTVVICATQPFAPSVLQPTFDMSAVITAEVL
jgi:hypothetical protein